MIAAPHSRKILSILNENLSKTLFLVMSPLSSIYTAIQIVILSLTMPLSLIKLAFIDLAIRIVHFSIANFISIPFSFNFISSVINVGTKSKPFVLEIVPCEVISVFVIEGAVSWNKSFIPSTFETISVVKNYYTKPLFQTMPPSSLKHISRLKSNFSFSVL